MSNLRVATTAFGAPLLVWWQQRNRRERTLVILLSAAALLALLDALVWQPVHRERRQVQHRITMAEQSINRIGEQSKGALERPGSLEQQTAELQQNLASVQSDLAAIRNRVIAPGLMTERLRALLESARGLNVLSFRNLPATALGAEPGSTTPATPNTTAGTAGSQLYRHPLEIKLSGRFSDLLSFVTKVEDETQGFFLANVQFDSTGTGPIEARIELFTLGTEATWLTL